MLLQTRSDGHRLRHAASTTTEIARTSRLVSRLTGYAVQPNKAIVGRNAFAHESGIHQDGVLKERTTYEIMDATTVGLDSNALVLGKHSGRHALRQALEDLGFQVDGQALNQAFKRFKEIADKKKQVTAMDLEALVTDELREAVGTYTLEWFDVEASTRRPPHATVAVRTPEGAELQGSFTGDGPVDAIFRAINVATGVDAQLREFRVDAVTGGQDALGEVSVIVELDGQSASGQGVATDILEAAAIAYVRALGVGRAQGAGRGARRRRGRRPSRRRLTRLVDDLAGAPSASRRSRATRSRCSSCSPNAARRSGLRARAARVRPRRRCAPPDWPGEEVAARRSSGAHAHARRQRAPPRLALCGHVDVVDVGHRAVERATRSPATSPSGRVHGRGSVDMKAGVIAAMHGLAAAAPGREVVLHCVSLRGGRRARAASPSSNATASTRRA